MGKKVRRHEAHRLFHRRIMSEHGDEGEGCCSVSGKRLHRLGQTRSAAIQLMQSGIQVLHTTLVMYVDSSVRNAKKAPTRMSLAGTTH